VLSGLVDAGFVDEGALGSRGVKTGADFQRRNLLNEFGGEGGEY